MSQLPSTNNRYRHGCFIATENAANVHNAAARLDAQKENPLWGAEDVEEVDASQFIPARLGNRRRP